MLWSGARNEQVRALLAAKADVNAFDGGALTTAARKGDIEAVRRRWPAARRRQQQTFRVDVYDWTALMKASWAGHADVVRALLAAGADIGARSDNGDTALSLATEFRKGEVIDILKAADFGRPASAAAR